MAAIRPAQRSDVTRLQAIERAAGEVFRSVGLDLIADDDPPSAETLLHHIDDGTAWVAVDGATQVGYAIASVLDGEAHLDQVSVVPEAAGRRIGEQLLRSVCDWAAASGLESLTLTSFRDVPWNGPYYRRLGFVELDDAELGPQLAARRAAERAAGIDIAPRVAMRRHL